LLALEPLPLIPLPGPPPVNGEKRAGRDAAISSFAPLKGRRCPKGRWGATLRSQAEQSFQASIDHT